MSLGGFSFGGESLAGGVRRTMGRDAAEGAAELGGAVPALGSVLGVQGGESVVATPRKRPTMSVVGGGGGGG